MEDIQSWWEVPSIAYFCSLFRSAFNLLDFDIEELEEALLTDGSEDCASSLLTELLVRLLNGCLGNNDISAFNYQMFLRRLFRQKCQETGRINPFNTDIDFQFLPLRTKVEILYALCDFRLDAEDVFELFKNLDAESLRVEPLGWDTNDSAYWYFYGTRLYREDYKKKNKKKKDKKKKKGQSNNDWQYDENERVWQVVCFTEADWTHLTDKFKTSTSRIEKELYQSLSENFVPEIPRLFQEKERMQRKRLLELAPRRTSNRVLQKIKQKEEENKQGEEMDKEEGDTNNEDDTIEPRNLGREHRAKRREQLRSQSVSSDASHHSSVVSEKIMPLKATRRKSKDEKWKEKKDEKERKNSADRNDSKDRNDSMDRNDSKDRNNEERKSDEERRSDEGKKTDKVRKSDKEKKGKRERKDEKERQIEKDKEKAQKKRSKNLNPPEKGEPPPDAQFKTGRKTNNSLACATGQIVIPDTVETGSSNRKKLKTSQIFSQTEEDVQTDMYKVLEQLTAHEDAWPFMDPVEEEYAPNYYAVIRRPMDLKKMEERLDNGYYTDFTAFHADFKLIVNNCRLYNGQDNEYTVMVDNLQNAFDKLTERYIHRISSSDEEIAVEYQMPTPSRKHKMKTTDDSTQQIKKKKRSTKSDSGEKSKTSSIEKIINAEKEEVADDENIVQEEQETVKQDFKDEKTSHKSKDGKTKKKRKSHHHHSKHSKSHKKTHKSSEKDSSKKEAKLLRKQKHLMKKEKSKLRKKKRRQSLQQEEEVIKSLSCNESLESPSRSRSASPLPSIHTLTPSPTPSPTPLIQPSDQLNDPDFFKDKYDKIKERRRQATKDPWDSVAESKQRNLDKEKQNVSAPDKDKNHKLRETIEKLKAKHETYKETLIFDHLYPKKMSSAVKNSISSPESGSTARPDVPLVKESLSEYEFTDEPGETGSQNSKKEKEKKGPKKVSAAKNEIASEALEQAVKDISTWLDDTPKIATDSSSSLNSPAPTVSTEEQDSRLDDDFSGDRGQQLRKECRKRPSSREPKIPSKRRELQRTIERLQPGKSKGNLITNVSSPKEEVVPLGPHNKPREIKSVLTIKPDEMSPKLSLGSVLPSVGFTLGKDHKFDEETETKLIEKTPLTLVEEDTEDSSCSLKIDDLVVVPALEMPVELEKGKEKEKEPLPPLPKFSQEKATPNLSAWFKAFGAPKSTPSVTKKKCDETDEEKSTENPEKPPSPKNMVKSESPPDVISPIQEGGDSPMSPMPNVASTTPRQRRTSTGSSISERSSFSQDLDSPRHQMSHTSPLLQSPASPRIDDFQKISYPIINGTVRAGFYQDTASIKSSPEKSCSPREAPQSPYSPYSQHVYASNSTAATPNPNYLIDQNRSPLLTYGQSQAPPYYDSRTGKPLRVHEDYNAVGPDASYTPIQLSTPYSPVPSLYSQHSQHSPYSPQTHLPHTPAPTAMHMSDPRAPSLYPVKKRTYNEPNEMLVSAKAHEKSEVKIITENVNQNKEFPQKSAHSMSNEQLVTSREDMALALSKKDLKNNHVPEKTGNDYMERQPQSAVDYSDDVIDLEAKPKQAVEILPTEKHTDITKGSAIDMVNMGYFVPESERRSEISDLDLLTALKEMQKLAKPRHLENRSDPAMKSPNEFTNLNKYCNTPVPEVLGTIEKIQNELHNMCYEKNQSPTNFTLKDVEIASKKVFSAGAINSNWNQTRKPDMGHLNYQADYSRAKSNIQVPSPSVSTFNKALHTQQLESFSGAHSPMLRGPVQHNLPSELRIPNPRGMMKNDLMGHSPMVDNDVISRTIESSAAQKNDKSQSQPIPGSMQYKTPYSNHSAALDSLNSIPNLPQMLERYTNEERYLSSFGTSNPSLYHEKTLQMAQMFNKSLPSDVSSSASIYSQATGAIAKDNMAYKTVSAAQTDRSKSRRKRISEQKLSQVSSSQTFHSPSTSDALSAVKTSLVPGSAFNFGPTASMGLSSSLYSDNSGFFSSNSTANQLMAANYMAAAAAAHQRTVAENSVEKLVKPAHQNAAHTSPGSFPFIGHSQVRAGYPFVGADPSSPLYQQYLQRHQEELLRQTGAQIMGLYPAGYPTSLAARQPYDSITRPSWL